MPESHTASEQWQSFELRMRRRRVERCTRRATAALDAGLLAEARSAIDEVALLEPLNLEAVRLKARLTTLEAAPPAVKPAAAPSADSPAAARTASAPAAAPRVVESVAPFAIEPALDLPLPSVSSREPARTKRRGGWLRLAAALTLLAGTVGWLWSGSSPYQVRQPGPAAGASPAAIPGSPIAPVGNTASRATERTGVDEPGIDAQPVSDPVPAAGGRVTIRSAIENAVTATGAGIGKSTPAPPTGARAAAGGEPALPSVSLAQPQAANLPGVRQVENPVLEYGAVSGAPGPPKPVAPPAASPEPVAGSPVIRPPDSRRLDVAPGDAVPAPPAPSVRAGMSDDHRIRVALNRYQTAYSRLDARAAADVWPAVDRRALQRAFDGLADQTVTFDRCDIRVQREAAEADCVGSARWTPRVGGGSQSASRRWRFDLRHRQGDWIIVSAKVR